MMSGEFITAEGDVLQPRCLTVTFDLNFAS